MRFARVTHGTPASSTTTFPNLGSRPSEVHVTRSKVWGATGELCGRRSKLVCVSFAFVLAACNARPSQPSDAAPPVEKSAASSTVAPPRSAGSAPSQPAPQPNPCKAAIDRLIQGLKAPLVVDVYASHGDPNVTETAKALLTLLRRFERSSAGKVVVHNHDTTTSLEEKAAARAAGLKRLPWSTDRDSEYFGFVSSAMTPPSHSTTSSRRLIRRF